MLSGEELQVTHCTSLHLSHSQLSNPFPSATLSGYPLNINLTYCQIGPFAFRFDNKHSAFPLSVSSPNSVHAKSEMGLLLLCAASLMLLHGVDGSGSLLLIFYLFFLS